MVVKGSLIIRAEFLAASNCSGWEGHSMANVDIDASGIAEKPSLLKPKKPLNYII